MDHAKALSGRSVQRYLLGEMSTAEVEEFERHYFECDECAADVETGEIFLANARAALADAEPAPAAEAAKEDTPPEARESFWDAVTSWWNKPAFIFPSAAAVVLGAICVYQNVFTIPGLREPGLREALIVPPFELVGTVRGSLRESPFPPGHRRFLCRLTFPPTHILRIICVSYLWAGARYPG